MKNIKCIIVDDEPVARKIIREFISHVQCVSVLEEFENTVKAKAFLKKNQIDLIFLDIAMPGISGLEWLRDDTINCLVIFTTAFPDYALEGYELDIVDYLVKPISYQRFTKAVDRAREYLELKTEVESIQSANWIFVRTDKRIEKINVHEILFIETMGNYVCIVTTGKNVLAYLTLKSIKDQLPDSNFVQIHQSYIVNFSKIEIIEHNQIKIGKRFFPIGRNYKDAVMHVIERRMLKR